MLANICSVSGLYLDVGESRYFSLFHVSAANCLPVQSMHIIPSNPFRKLDMKLACVLSLVLWKMPLVSSQALGGQAGHFCWCAQAGLAFCTVCQQSGSGCCHLRKLCACRAVLLQQARLALCTISRRGFTACA